MTISRKAKDPGWKGKRGMLKIQYILLKYFLKEIIRLGNNRNGVQGRGRLGTLQSS